eukprot:c12453_g3_i5.p1 GENE.c12453_g3_i5~~c12453_g3_i5.p1  ORF type:complete len:267 (+),score=44.92 c12453_g3_i5:108-908(+)
MSQVPSSSVLHQGLIPNGVRPGTLFDVLLPDGSRIPDVALFRFEVGKLILCSFVSVRCPPNRQPGDRFLLRPYSVRIPEGVKKGKVFTVQANQRLFQVQCPRGKKSGDTILIRIPEFPEPPPQAPIDFSQLPPQEREFAPIVSPIPEFRATPEYTEKMLVAADDIDVSNDFICPITQELMLDPVIAVDGHTYERKAMESWLTNHDTSPRTNEHLMSKVLIPNLALRQRIMRYVDTISSLPNAQASTVHLTSTATSASPESSQVLNI